MTWLEVTAVAVPVAMVATAFVLGRYFALLDHREERAANLTMLRSHDVQKLADECVDLRKTMDGAFAAHEKRICDMEMTVTGPPRPRPR